MVGAWKNTTEAPIRGLVGRAGTTSAFDLARWAPSDATAEYVEHFWSVSWDLRGQEPFDSTVITFPSLHLTHEWGSDGPRHGFALPNTLVHGVVERVFHTTISQRGSVVGARFRPGGFTARFNRDAAPLTGRVQPVDDELFSARVPFDDDVESAAARLDDAIATGTGERDPTYVALTGLVDRIRDDDRLHRVEQVMTHSPWSSAHHAAGVPSLRRRPGEVGAVPLPAAARRTRDRDGPVDRLRRPRGPAGLVRPVAFHQRLPLDARMHAGGVRRQTRVGG